MTGIVYIADDVTRALHDVSQHVLSVVSSVNDLSLQERNGSAQLLTPLQTFFKLRLGHHLQDSLLEIVLTHALAAERVSPGAFIDTVSRVAQGIVNVRSGIIYSQNNDPTMSLRTIPATKDDVNWVVTRFGKGLADVILEALDLVGFAGKVIVEKTESMTTSVELIRGYTFLCRSELSSAVKLTSCRIACVDGFVESVGEIHHLLEDAAASKESVVFFSRGFSDDVKHTLRVNYDRGTLRVIPVLVAYDLAGANTLVDIAVAVGGDVVSSLKGDLISTMRLADLPRIESCTVQPAKQVIVSSRTGQAVKAHVSHLKSKRTENSSVDNVADLIDQRIRSLSPNHAVIRIPDDKDYVTKAQSIDYVLRAIASLCSRGTVIADGKKELSLTVLASQVHSSRCLQTLNDLGAVILLPSEGPRQQEV